MSTSFSQRERNKRARNARANVTSHSCSASEARAPHARVLAFFSLRARFSRATRDATRRRNEFTTEGGKLHGAVAESMKETGMLEKSAKKINA